MDNAEPDAWRRLVRPLRRARLAGKLRPGGVTDVGVRIAAQSVCDKFVRLGLDQVEQRESDPDVAAFQEANRDLVGQPLI